MVTCPLPLTDWLRGQDDQHAGRAAARTPRPRHPAARRHRRARRPRRQPGLGEQGSGGPGHLHARRAGRAGGRRRRPRPGAGRRGRRAGRAGRRPGAGAGRRAARWSGSRSPGATTRSPSCRPRARRAGSTPPGSASRPRRSTASTCAALLAELPEADRRLLTTLAHGSPVGRTRDAAVDRAARAGADAGAAAARARACCCAATPRPSSCPARSASSLRGDSPLGTVRLAEPELRTTRHKVSTVDATGAGEALELLRRAESLVELWRHGTGRGAQVRRARRARRCAGWPATSTPTSAAPGCVAELVVGAGLVGDSASAPTPPSGCRPRSPTRGWSPPRPNQWATLAAAWLDLPRLPGLAGMRDAKDECSRRCPTTCAARPRRPSAGGCSPRSPTCRAGTGVRLPRRAGRRAGLAGAAPGRAAARRDRALDAGRGDRARRGRARRDHRRRAGRCSTTARRPRPSGWPTSLPEPVDHVLVQADLTVVAPGPLEPQLAAEIGAGRRRRVGGQRDRLPGHRGDRAPRAGRRPHRGGPARAVPQPVAHAGAAVADLPDRRRGPPARPAARRRGGVVPALRRPGAAGGGARPPGARRRCELRRIAPTVLVSPLPLADVLDELRAAGFAPAAEGADGQVLDLRPAGHRLPAAGPAPGAAPPGAAERRAAARHRGAPARGRRGGRDPPRPDGVADGGRRRGRHRRRRWRCCARPSSSRATC